MWTSTTVPSESNEALDINHVVLLAKRSTSSPELPVNCDADDYEAEPLQEDDRTCDYSALAADSFATADPVQDNSEIAPSESADMSNDVSTSETHESLSGEQSDSDTGEPEPQLPQLPGGQFLSTEMVIVLLTGSPPGACN